MVYRFIVAKPPLNLPPVGETLAPLFFKALPTGEGWAPYSLLRLVTGFASAAFTD